MKRITMKKVEWTDSQLSHLLVFYLILSLIAVVLPSAVAIAESKVEFVELWHATYDNGFDDEAYSVAVDSEDNVIVTGYITNKDKNNDYYTIKYDEAGKEIWSKSYDSGYDDKAHDVAVDSGDNIIVTGYSSDDSTDVYRTIKYDKNGNVIWNKTFDDGSTDQAEAVAVDSQDNIIVTGCSRNDPTSKYRTIKYDKNGDMIWNKTYISAISPMNEAFGVAVDSEDNVIITGQSGYPIGTWHTIKYNGADGAQIWLVTYGVGGDNEGHCAAVDSEDNVIITGTSQRPPYSPYSSQWDYHTIKYDKNGKEIWNNSYETGNTNWPEGLGIDSEDRVIVTGYAFGDTTYNYYTIMYDKDGNEIGHATYDNNHNDEAGHLAVDSKDRIIVTGFSSDGSTKNYYTIKYEIVTIGKSNGEGSKSKVPVKAGKE